MIQFNKDGFITPAEVIESDLVTFEKIFVFNEHRQLIFQEYLLFLDELKALHIGSFYQWLNGSFTTLKSKPNDIDVVTFLDFNELKKHQEQLYLIKKEFKKRKIDNYLVSIYPSTHSDQNLFKLDKAEWLFDFSMRSKQPKGFIQINF